MPQEGAVPEDALDAFAPLPAGGDRSGASASAADEVFAAAFEKYCASEASPGDVLQLLLESGPRPRSLPLPVALVFRNILSMVLNKDRASIDPPMMVVAGVFSIFV